MVDIEQLKQLRALGVKSIEIHKDGAHFVEFFEPSAPTMPDFGRLDMDTLVPPAPDSDPKSPPVGASTSPALSRLLQKGSVS